MFKTLNSEIEKQLKESIYLNDTFKKYKYSFLENIIIKLSKRPILQSFIFILFFLFLAFIIYEFRYLQYFIPPYKFEWKVILSSKDLIFNAQVTILALLFPLVIGFVGVLIKDDIANKSLWRIYSRYSGFMIVGFSGILLVISLTIIELFEPFLLHKQNIYYALSISFYLWFLLNMFLLAWLIYATFEFVKIEGRDLIILKYLTNIVIINEVRKRLYTILPINSIHYKLLPNFDKSENCKVEFFDFKNNDEILLYNEFKKERYLENIKFYSLSFALKLWYFRNNYFLLRENQKLILPITGSGYASKKYNLVLGNNNLTFIEKTLINYSYSFSKGNRYDDVNITYIVDSLFSNIHNALKENNQRQIENSLRKIQNFLSIIFDVTTFIDDNKKIDNWILLPDNSFFSNKLLYVITRELYSFNIIILKHIIEKRDSYIFSIMCYFYRNTINNSKIPNEIIKSLLDLNYYFWIELIKENKLVEYDFLDILYKDYIGGWESWSIIIKEKKILSENSITLSINNLHNNLINTCCHIISSLKYKNKTASIWAVNILNYWFHNYFPRKYSYRYLSNVHILNSSIFKNKKKKEIFNFVFNDKNLNLEKQYESIYANALQNECKQSKIITVAYILNDDELLDENINLVFALMNNQKIIPNTNLNRSFSKSIPSEILEIYILNHSYFYELMVSSMSYSLIEEFNKIYQNREITGRSYSISVRDGNEAILSSMKVLLLSNSINIFDLDRNIYDFFFSELFGQQNRDNLIKIFDEFIELTEKEKDKTKKLLDIDDISKFIENYNKSIDNIKVKLTTKNEEIISSKEIGEVRKNIIKEYLSSQIFSKDSVEIPFVLFKEINYLDDVDEKFKFIINLNNIDKRELLDDDLPRAGNEDEFYKDLLSSNIYIKIFEDFFNEIEYIQKDYDTEKELIINMLKDINNEKDRIFFIGSIDISIFLSNLVWEKENLPFEVSERDNSNDDYICHINDIPTYSIRNFNIDFCLSLNINIFKEMNFKEFEKDIFVDLEFEEDTKNVNRGKFVITTFIQTVLDQNYDNYKYILNKREE